MKALVIRFVLAVTTVAVGQYSMAAKHPVPLEPKTDSAKCLECHSAHGVPSGSAGMAGDRLVNFDVNVVAPYRGALTYSNGKCALVCHMMDHDGTGAKPTPHLPTTPL